VELGCREPRTKSSFALAYRYFEEFIIAPMIMCVVWLGVCIVGLCPSKRSSGSKGVPLLVQERCKKAARLGALGRALAKLGLGLALVAVLAPESEAFDVCDAPKDCHQLSEEELGNVNIEGFAGALPACILGCVGTAGIDVPGLVATEELPECQPMCKLVTCAVDACGQGDIDRTQFCLLQDVLRNTCQEDFDAGVTYGRGSVPIVDL